MDIVNMNLVWLWILFLYTTTFTASTPCDVSFETTCNNDCSQPGYFEHANDTFFCKIRLKEGIEVFQNENKKLLENASIVIGAPKLMSVDWYLKPYLVKNETRWNPSLNISYQLPDGFFGLRVNGRQYSREYLLKGVLMNFTSLADLRVQDVYYHDCPKYRLFNFSTYSPSFYESEKPRILTYDCMVGLDENDSRVYMISLQSLPGAGITYYVTTYNQKQVWRPAIATAFRNATSLHVVFEQAPFEVKSYEVELFESEENLWKPKSRAPAQTKIKLRPTDNSHSFEVVKGGYYFVQVSVLGNNSKCPDDLCVSKSWILAASSLPFSTAENHSWLDKNHGILAPIVGCLAGFFLVLLLFFIVLKKRVKDDSTSAGQKKTSVLVVYSYGCSEFDNLVESFARHIQDRWNIDVHLDKWEETKSQGFNVNWCSEKLLSVDFLLCVCSQGWIETFNNGNILSSDRQYGEYFKNAVEEVNRMRDRNDHRCPEILTIYFEFMTDPVPSDLKHHKSYMLMKSKKELFCHLHNCKNVPRKFNRAVDGLGECLQDALNRAQTFFETHPKWFVRRNLNMSVIQEPDHENFSFAKAPSTSDSKKNFNSEINSGKSSQSESHYHDLNKKLSEFNKDSDDEVNASDVDVSLNDHNNKAILVINAEYKSMESPSSRPSVRPKDLRPTGNNVKTHPEHSHHCRVHSGDHCQAVRNSESTSPKEHTLLHHEIPEITSRAGNFQHTIHHHNNLHMNHHHSSHPLGSPPHAHHKVHPPSLQLRPPAPLQNGEQISCSHIDTYSFSSWPNKSTFIGDPRHPHESTGYPHHHRDVIRDEYPTSGLSPPHKSWQPQSVVNYEENFVPPFSPENYVDPRLSSPIQRSQCVKHKDVGNSITGKSFIDQADPYYKQSNFNRVQHLNSPQKGRFYPGFTDRHHIAYNNHQGSHFALQNPVQLDRHFKIDQPHSIEISDLSEERYPFFPESDTFNFPNDESQSPRNKEQISAKEHIPFRSDKVPIIKFLHGNSHVNHQQNNLHDKNMRSSSYHQKQSQLFKKGMGDSEEENELLLTHSYPSETSQDTWSRLSCHAETENQLSNEYQINPQRERINEEFVPPDDLSGCEEEREKNKPVSESMESVMEELAGLNETDSYEMENDPIERPSSVI